MDVQFEIIFQSDNEMASMNLWYVQCWGFEATKKIKILNKLFSNQGEWCLGSQVEKLAFWERESLMKRFEEHEIV